MSTGLEEMGGAGGQGQETGWVGWGEVGGREVCAFLSSY